VHDHGRVDLAASQHQQGGTTPLGSPAGLQQGGTTPLEPPAGLDRQPASATTKRAHVRGILEELIATELHPGDAIPSERALVIRLGVSRVTVRQAIADLVGAGVLERVQGKGTYLTGPQVDSRLHLTSFSREMRARGLIPATVVLSAAEQPADDDVSYALRIRPGQSVVRVERLRTADGTPMAYEVGHYPSALFPGLLQRELGRAKQKIATIDRIDPATGLVRFSHFQETLRRDLAMARRDRRFVTILVFEIVEFAVYRQTFGDKAADSCQRMIGTQIMRALRRAGDICARYDETTLVAAVVGQHASEVQPLTERIADGVAQLRLHNPRAKGSRYIETRVILIGCPPGAHDDPEPLIERALAEARGANLTARVG